MMQVDQTIPFVFYPPDYQDMAKNFLDHYDLETEIVCPDSKMHLFTSRQERTCRFCNKGYPFVTFRNDAHIISELIGNRYLVSDFECDVCNFKFGKYENHLANFLGISRTLNKTIGKEKVPSFTAPNKAVRAEKINLFAHDAIQIVRNDTSDNTYSYDPVSGANNLVFKKNSYIPILVYKSILKMALSCMKKECMNDYQIALKYLFSAELDEKAIGFCKMATYTFPINCGYPSPFAAIYKKKDTAAKIPTHIFTLFFQNMVFQIFVPHNTKDLQVCNGVEIPIYWQPPIFGYLADAVSTPIIYRVLDLSSTELLKNEVESLGFRIHEEDKSKLVSLDLFTGEINDNPGRPKNISKVILVEKGTVIDPGKIAQILGSF